MDWIRKGINADWKFILKEEREAFQKDYPENGWEKVTLPHDWSVRYPLSREYSSGTGYAKGGTGWYRKHFILPEEWKGKRLFLLFDGIYKNSQVWINGYYLGRRPYGYISFQYDISDFVYFGETENVVAVRVAHEDVADSRWFTGNGITRKVSLLVYDTVSPMEGGIFFSSGEVSEESAEIVVSNEFLSVKEIPGLILANKIYDENGRLVLSMENTTDAKPGGICSVENRGRLNAPCLWSPDHPFLYTMETSYLDPSTGNTAVIDRQKTGIRKIAFDPDRGFFLNGICEVFKGVCVHHDGGCLGAAMTKEVWKRRLKKLKTAGCNAIRMSHNPHMPELYELCDEMGFLVMDEAFDEWEAPKNKWHIGHNVYPPKHEGYAEEFPQWHERDLAAMVRWHRSHPCIVMWSIGNEIDYPNDPYCHPLFTSMTGNNDKNKPAAERQYNPAKPNAERLPVIASRLAAIVRENDPTRPVTAAVAFPELSTRIGYLDDLDVVSYNYKEHLYETDHSRFPEKPFLGGENSHSYSAWKAVLEHPYISGQFLWTGVDYLGECTGWPVHGSPAGLLTTAGFEKTAWYRRKSWWSDEPFLHIVTARRRQEAGEWDEMHESWNYVGGEEIEVRCYTNLKDTELYLNGRSCAGGTENAELGFFSWIVIYEAGVLEAVSGKHAYRLETVTAPVGLLLRPVIEADDLHIGENNTVNDANTANTAIAANGADATNSAITADMGMDTEWTARMEQVELFVLDEKDRIVLSDRSKVTVGIEGDGELMGLDNGDLSDTADYFANYRTALEGKLMIYVRRVGKGSVKVTAESPFLKAASLELPAL